MSEDAIGFFVIGLILVGVPALVSALIGHARGRRWYWFALLGLLSWFGPLVAAQCRTAAQPAGLAAVSPELRQRAARVQLTIGAPPEGARLLGEVEVTLRSGVSDGLGHESAPPSHAAANEELRLKATELGADAVAAVEYFRQKPTFWTFSPQHVLTARGQAMTLADGESFGNPGQADAAAALADMPDPRRALESALGRAGTWSIIWAFLNALIVTYQMSTLEPGESFIIPPAVIYALSVWLLVKGTLLLRVRTPGMLIVDGFTMMALGLVNIVSWPLLGLMQLFWGVQSIVRSSKINQELAEYDRRRAILEGERDALKDAS